MATLKPENENAEERYERAPAWGPEEEAAVERVWDEIGRERAAGKGPLAERKEPLRYLDWEHGFSVAVGMVENGCGAWEPGPGYRVVERGLTLQAAQRIAAEVGGVVVAPGAD